MEPTRRTALDPMSLNPEQREAVEHVEGPILVLAGAGSGKTRVLTVRIARLIEEHGVPPERILAVTFTNKAAGEMRERVRALLGRDPAGAWLGTFHSLGARLLRRHADGLGWDSAFTIFDAEETLREIKRVMEALQIDPKRWRPQAVRAMMSDVKNELVTPETFGEEHGDGFDLFARTVARVYPAYQKSLREQNAFDFDDLLVKPVELLQGHPGILERYQERFAFLLVDEYQDTNHAQFRFLELLARKHRNLMVVGDDDQCVVAGTKIPSARGLRPVEEITRGELVRGAAGCGRTALSAATPHPPRLYRGRVVRVTTERGCTLEATPNHLIFGRLIVDPELWYVYLMQRDDTGFRIGVTRGVRARRPGRLVNALSVRLDQERADRLWVLATTSTEADARCLEVWFSLSSGIPAVRFHAEEPDGAAHEEGAGPCGPPVRSRARTLSLQERLQVADRAEALMSDLLLFPRYPHHEAGTVGRGGRVRRRVLYTLFGDGRRCRGRPWSDHRIQLVTSGGPPEEAVGAAGIPIRQGSRSTWRVETARKDHDRGWRYSRRLATEIDGDVRVRARLVGPSGDPADTGLFDLLPISHMYPGMEVAALDDDGALVSDRVADRSLEWYEGPVFDLSVDDLRTYVAGGICGHNSIYGWRGADIRNILDFERTFRGAKVVRLERNYRSTSTILEAANRVIRRNRDRKEKTLHTDREEGERLTLVETADERDEAGWILGEIEARIREGQSHRLRDFTVLYRTNAQSRALEDAFRRRGTPYQIVGGVRFYERREIQDVLAYLRLISNPVDMAAFDRVVNVPRRGIGDATRTRLGTWAEREGLNLLEASARAEEAPGLPASGVQGLRRFAALVRDFSARAATHSVGPLLEELVGELDFLTHLRDEGPEGEDRAENVKELIAGAMDFEARMAEEWDEAPPDHFTELDLFLQHVALVTDIDRHDPDSDAVTFMTLHNAKGLEFPVVFIAGLEEGLFPLGRAYEEPAQLEEERRLFYVGVTRARDKVYMSWARERRRAGDFTFGSLSSFVRDIPEEVVEERRSPGLARQPASFRGRGEGDARGRGVDREVARTSPRAHEEEAFEAGLNQDLPHLVRGERVSHPTFGSGTVLEVSGFGRDVRITVNFDSVGPKKLLARYAGLEKEF